MKCTLLRAAALAVGVMFAATAANADTLLYSYETTNPFGPDGFFGLGATVTQDTIGATQGTKSMKYAVTTGGFVGARTESVIPAALNDPPGVPAIQFDMTIVDAYPGTFADIGVTVFGHQLNSSPQVFGQQVQFAATVPIAGKAPGTYLNQTIPLSLSVGPYRAGESFNDIFGPTAPNDLTTASAFQFFISKNADQPVTVYIDNVRVVPEPAALCSMSAAGLAGMTLGRRRRS